MLLKQSRFWLKMYSLYTPTPRFGKCVLHGLATPTPLKLPSIRPFSRNIFHCTREEVHSNNQPKKGADVNDRTYERIGPLVGAMKWILSGPHGDVDKGVEDGSFPLYTPLTMAVSYG